jgi:NitT/TauT family transport system permease protein
VTAIEQSARGERRPHPAAARASFYLTITVTFAALMLAWELAGRMVNHLFFAPVSEVAAEFLKAIVDPRARLLHALLETLSLLIPGFVIASFAGIAIGVAMGRRELLYQALDPYVTIFYNTPRVVLIPVLMLWLGTGALMKIVVVALAAIFPVIVNTVAGVRDVSAQLTEPARSLRATERQLMTKVILPASVPFIIAGIKLGLGRAITTVVVAELFVSVSGLGGLLHAAGSTYQMAKMLVPAVILAGMGIAIDGLLSRIERAAARWYGGWQ